MTERIIKYQKIEERKICDKKGGGGGGGGGGEKKKKKKKRTKYEYESMSKENELN